MHKQKHKQIKQCFDQQDFQQQQTKYLQAPFHFDLVVNVNKQLPANQLRNILRPQKLKCRTLISNKNMTLLSPFINQSSIQSHIKSKSGNSKIKFSNKQKFTIQEYFTKKQFKEVYNKFYNFQTDRKSFSGKILSIDSVSDYNSKLFREIQYQNSSVLQNDSIDADFQCGNLCRAFSYEAQQNNYFLILQNDINTYGYNIWFFFRFKNIKKGLRTFHLMNLVKKTDNYKKGMQISIFSVKKYKNQKRKWFKGGDKINFVQSNFTRMFHLTERYYSLSFQYNFEEDHDQVYFAMNQPYTYTRMINHLEKVSNLPFQSDIKVQVNHIGHSLADNIIPSIKVWKQPLQNKQTILIMARQHPCETVSSFVCEGMINYLMKQNIQTNILLQKYQIVIIPMVNPDGVTHGCSRCNLAGLDLNRQWSEFLIKQFTPQSHKIKKYIMQIHKQNPIKYFFDLHGHGKKLNSFFFSCKKADNPSTRLMELLMNRIQPRFNILDCTYGIDRDKQNTIRSQLFNMGVENCFTLETSLMGYQNSQGLIKQYTQEDLFHIAESVWKGIFVVDSPTQVVKKVLGFSKQQLLESSQIIIEKLCEKQKDQKKNLTDDNASDSDPQGDILDINQRLQTCCKNNTNLKKKITQTIKKQKIKRKKNQNKTLKKQQRKNSSNSQNQSVQILTNSQKAQVEQKHVILQKQLSLSQQKRNMNKLSLLNKRTTIYSKKRKQNRQNINQIKILLPQNEIQNKTQSKKFNRQISNATEIKFLNHRLKTEMKNDMKTRKASSSVIYEYPNEGMMPTKRKMSYKLKTQGSVPNTSQKDIPGVVYYQQPKSQIKYSQLKQQSLRSLLIDTFSVLKIKPKLSIKRYLKVNPSQRQKKQKLRNQFNNQKIKPLINQKNLTLSQKHIQQNNKNELSVYSDRLKGFQKDHDLGKTLHTHTKRQFKRNLTQFKYKRFQSFLHSKKQLQREEKHNNSVFYYFPVL